MNKNSFASPNATKSRGVLSSLSFFTSGTLLSALGIIFVALVIPLFAYSADKLIVEDSSGDPKFTVRDDGSVMLNTDSFDGPSWARLYGAADNSIAGIALDSFGVDSAIGGGGMFRFARGSQASKAAVQNGDRLGFFVFSGYDGTAFLSTAALTAKIEGPVSAGNVPTKFVFEANATGFPRPERMVISSSGSVGIGTSFPSYPLHMGSGAYVSAGGVWTDASSREYKENIKDLSTEEAIETLEGLNPVTYDYKMDKEDKHVGFIAEDVPELVATKDRKGLSSMDIVAVLTKVVQIQRKTIAELSEKVDSLQKEMDRTKGMN